jgi:hypothetical protein
MRPERRSQISGWPTAVLGAPKRGGRGFGSVVGDYSGMTGSEDSQPVEPSADQFSTRAVPTNVVVERTVLSHHG